MYDLFSLENVYTGRIAIVIDFKDSHLFPQPQLDMDLIVLFACPKLSPCKLAQLQFVFHQPAPIGVLFAAQLLPWSLS